MVDNFLLQLEIYLSEFIELCCVKGNKETLTLGNLNSKRDIGHAREYVEGMWRMLQADEPDTFVLATNRTETVRDFVRMAFKGAGIELHFKGKEEKEIAINTSTGKTVMRINPKFYRPAEVELLIGNPAKAKAKLGWAPNTTLEQLCQMVEPSRVYMAQ